MIPNMPWTYVSTRRRGGTGCWLGLAPTPAPCHPAPWWARAVRCRWNCKTSNPVGRPGSGGVRRPIVSASAPRVLAAGRRYRQGRRAGARQAEQGPGRRLLAGRHPRHRDPRGGGNEVRRERDQGRRRRQGRRPEAPERRVGLGPPLSRGCACLSLTARLSTLGCWSGGFCRRSTLQPPWGVAQATPQSNPRRSPPSSPTSRRREEFSGSDR